MPIPIAITLIYLVGCIACFAVGRFYERRRRVQSQSRIFVSETFPHVESMRQISQRLSRFRPLGASGRMVRDER